MNSWIKVTYKSKINELVCDLDLSKEFSQILASRLAEKNLLLPDVRILFYRIRDSMKLQYFSEKDNMYCNNIEFLLNEMDVENFFLPICYRMFIDNLKLSLKCILLPNGNEFGSIFVGA